MGDNADPESPEGQAARDGQGGVGLLQRGAGPLREEAEGRLGRSAAGARGRAPGGRAARPGALTRVWAHLGRLGGARRSGAVPGSGSAEAAEGLTGARQAGVGQRRPWTPGRSTLCEGERPVNARGASSRQKFQTGLEAPPRLSCGPAPARRSPSGSGLGSASRPACAPRPPRPRSQAERFQCAGAPPYW